LKDSWCVLVILKPQSSTTSMGQRVPSDL
jgi:hypothetical protein